MNNLIAELEEWTRQVVHGLDELDYEELSGLVKRRQIMVDQLKDSLSAQPATDTEKERILALLKHDGQIMERMQQLKEEAGNWLQQRGQAKFQRNVYEAAYTPDSILMDRRN